MAVNFVYEGIESAGKTLLRSLTSEVLQETTNFTVATVGEPGGTKLGAFIRHSLLTSEFAEGMHPRTRVLLYSADRNELIENTILPFNAENPTGITVGDRSWASTLALQTVDGAEEAYIYNVQAPFIAKYPTKYLLVDIHEQEARVRLHAAAALGREINWRDKMPVETYRKQRMNYLALAKKFPDRFIIMDGFKSPWDLVFESRRIILTEHAKNPLAREEAIRFRDSFDYPDLQKIAHRYENEGRFKVGDMLFQIMKSRQELKAPNQRELQEAMHEEWREFGLTEIHSGRERGK